MERQPIILRKRKYRQTVKDQREDVHGAQHRPAIYRQPLSKPGTHLGINLCRKRASKRNASKDRTNLLIANPLEQELQSENIEKRSQRATLPDQTLDRENLWVLPVDLHHYLRVVVHHAAELRFESGVF